MNIEPQPSSPMPVGIDDGFADTKLALPDGRLLVTPSRARIGRSRVSWLNHAERRIFEYETEATVFSVGDVEAAATRFEGYACSGLNRAIVQHALQQAGLEGCQLEAVSGLPVSAYYRNSGVKRQAAINDKTENLMLPVTPRFEALPADIVFHEVIPEALAAWYDHVIVARDGKAQLDHQRFAVPMAVIDIGGRTTDTVVVRDQGVEHGASGSLARGLLDVKQALADALQERFDLESISDRALTHAVQQKRVRLFGRDHDVTAEVNAAKQELVEELYAEARRQLGRAMELDCVLFVGGGAMALAEHITDWFPNQQIAAQPAFANARGMLKYLQFVGERADAA
ncbi:MAG: ParM/StbA family protein [Woeseiaceae bacterium]|nr:ParM/StbA family protein [Woeseiaceae bacterium]